MGKVARLARERSAPGQLVTIRGIRNGLLFVLAEDATIAELIDELERLLQGSEREGVGETAGVTAYVDPGARRLTDDECDLLRGILTGKGNLVVKGFAGPPAALEESVKQPYIYKGTVRSGQVIEHDGDVVVVGDVNAGGRVIAAGDVVVMGHLRGFAQAGAAGDAAAVVAAVYFEPLQVSIGDVTRRAPERPSRGAEMEFAYLEGADMAVERMAMLGQHRARSAVRRTRHSPGER